MRVCDRIAEIRRERGLTQEQLAELIGVSQESVSQYERGKRNLNYKALQGMRKAGIDMNWFLDSTVAN
jgi:transcriptional regulator with XRE-family HTH domain